MGKFLKTAVVAIFAAMQIILVACGGEPPASSTNDDVQKTPSPLSSSAASPSSSPAAEESNMAPEDAFLENEVDAAEWLARVELLQSTKYLEYSKKDVDPVSLVSIGEPPEADEQFAGLSVADVTVSTDGAIDLTQVGVQRIEYLISYVHADTAEPLVEKREATFTVRDTKKPSIKLKEKNPEIASGDSYDAPKNIKSVSDKVGGKLERVEEEPESIGSDIGKEQCFEKGWYLLEGEVDSSIPGTYPITVTACDMHGNKAKKEFSVRVREPEAESEVVETAPMAQTRTYVLNTNTGKFHNPGCRATSRMNEANKQYVESTREDVMASGYEPCGICNP